jgi:hypothetical protein
VSVNAPGLNVTTLVPAVVVTVYVVPTCAALVISVAPVPSAFVDRYNLSRRRIEPLVCEPTSGNVATQLADANAPVSAAGVRNASPSEPSSGDAGSAVLPNVVVARTTSAASFEKFVIATVPFVHPLDAVAVAGAEPPSCNARNARPDTFELSW